MKNSRRKIQVQRITPFIIIRNINRYLKQQQLDKETRWRGPRAQNNYREESSLLSWSVYVRKKQGVLLELLHFGDPYSLTLSRLGGSHRTVRSKRK